MAKLLHSHSLMLEDCFVYSWLSSGAAIEPTVEPSLSWSSSIAAALTKLYSFDDSADSKVTNSTGGWPLM